MKGQQFGQTEPNGSHLPLFRADNVNMMGKDITWSAI
jgi:hypothetical protein